MKRDAQFYNKILDNLYDGVYVIDKNKKIIFWNAAAQRITGYGAQEVLGTCCYENIFLNTYEKGHKQCFDLHPVFRTLEDGKICEEEFYITHKNGHRIPVYSRAVPLEDTNGEVTGTMEIFIDKSTQMNSLCKIAELENLVRVDLLTRISNRKCIEDTIVSRLNELERYGWSFGILFIDLDDFKKINDTYSHYTGDKILKQVTTAMLTGCRLSDSLGRWAGDEFIAVIVNIDKEKLKFIANRFKLLIESSHLKDDGKDISTTAAIGATLAQKGETAEELIRRADALMYKSKLLGKNRITTDL